jgi:hypothetical protein
MGLHGLVQGYLYFTFTFFTFILCQDSCIVIRLFQVKHAMHLASLYEIPLLLNQYKTAVT